MDVRVVDHPLAAARLTTLRDAATDNAAFRAALRDLTLMLVYEATRDAATEAVPVRTPLAETTVTSKQLFKSSEGFSRCVWHNLVPTGDIVIDDADGNYAFGDGAAGFPTGLTNYQEFLSALVNQAGIGQNFDGNGQYLRVNTGGGAVLSSMAYPPGGFRNDVIFGNTQSDVLGTRPTFTSTVPPYRTDVPCHTNPLPDINGAAPVGPPSPAAP